MQNMFLSLMIDVTMALLLVVTIFYCRKLNQRIRVLQDSRSELAQIVREFDESTERATKSIAEIHEASRRISENIQHKIDKANYLVADLETAITRGNRAIDSVDTEGALGANRRGGSVSSRSAEPPRMAGNLGRAANLENFETPTSSRPVKARSRAEQDVLDALKNRGE
ncbi:MAG: DUF6468 domain-containing protein [Alphaproteobacteria bacterium]